MVTVPTCPRPKKQFIADRKAASRPRDVELDLFKIAGVDKYDILHTEVIPPGSLFIETAVLMPGASARFAASSVAIGKLIDLRADAPPITAAPAEYKASIGVGQGIPNPFIALAKGSTRIGNYKAAGVVNLNQPVHINTLVIMEGAETIGLEANLVVGSAFPGTMA